MQNQTSDSDRTNDVAMTKTRHSANAKPALRKVTSASHVVEMTGPLGETCHIPLTGSLPRRLGRRGDSSGATVTYRDPHLAKIHALLLPVGGEWFLSPEPSINGVYVRIDGPHQLRAGDEFIMGGTHGRVVEVAEGQPTLGSENASEPAKIDEPEAGKPEASATPPTPLSLELSGVEA